MAQTVGPEWGQSFTYEGFGNLLSKGITKGSAPMMNLTVDAASNRLQVAGMTYDANGNMTRTPEAGAITYDGRNRAQTIEVQNAKEMPGWRRVCSWPMSFQYAQNRYYSATYGRFTTPDPYRASGGPADPGSWNRYAYVVGDPVNLNDPRGLAACPVDSANSVWVCDTGGPTGGDGVTGSNDMQELPQGPFNDLTQIPGPGFVPFGIRLPHGNKYSAGQKAALQSGFSLAQLKIFDPDCIEAFLVSHSELLMTLRHTEYRVLDFGKGRRGSGAQTADTFSVHIKVTGIFFARASQISIPGQDAPDVRRMDPDTIRAFIFLHELGHQVGTYGPDTDLQINGRNSRRILDNCFRRGADGVYR